MAIKSVLIIFIMVLIAINLSSATSYMPEWMMEESKCDRDTSCYENILPLCKESSGGDSCYYSITIRLREAEKCYLIERNDTQEKCLTMISGIKENLSLCDDLDSEKKFCYSEHAIYNNNFTVCEILEKFDYICYDYFLGEWEDTVCEDIENLTKKDSCYHYLTFKTLDSECGDRAVLRGEGRACDNKELEKKSIERCEKMPNGRDSCLVSINSYMKNPEICELVDLSHKKDTCFSNLALHLGESYCDEIEEDFRIESCKNFFVAKDSMNNFLSIAISIVIGMVLIIIIVFYMGKRNKR